MLAGRGCACSARLSKFINGGEVANKKRAKAKATNKLKWIKPELTRVALNPEQAVLSCCDAVVRGVQMVAFPYLEQCFSGEGTECGISPSFNLASS